VRVEAPSLHAQTLARMEFWQTGQHVKRLAQPPPDRYLTFDVDSGGFNNIRYACLQHATHAQLTRHAACTCPPGWGWR
jgi:hypothetical protein